jgi:hypothetical protein
MSAASLHLLPPQLVEALVARSPGKFSGHSEDWAQWRRRWLPYIREVEESLPQMTEAQRIALLRNNVDAATSMVLDAEVEANPEITYDVIWARLDLELGGEDREQLRRKFRALRLQTRGKLAEREWREYYATLRGLAIQLGDIPEVELGRQMVEALGHGWQRRIAQEEDKRRDHAAVVLEGLPEDISSEEVVEMVTVETGVRPRGVQVRDKKVRVTPEDETHREAIKVVFDRQKFAGGQLVRVAPDLVELTAAEINRLMVRWLRVDQRVSGMGGEAAATRKPIATRWQREIGASGDERGRRRGRRDGGEGERQGQSLGPRAKAPHASQADQDRGHQ